MKMKYLVLVGVLSLVFLMGCVEEVEEPLDEEQVTGDMVVTGSVDHIANMPFEEVSEVEMSALDFAINDEYKAKATYQKVIEKFGEVKPFINIINAEQQHINLLVELYEKYDLDVPKDELYDQVSFYDSVAEACEIGVQAEIENADLYDEILKDIDNEDIEVVFIYLRDASRNNHLPAFERCGGLK